MHCNISESYCSNLFVRYLSMNFKDYFTSIKLVNAINLLLVQNILLQLFLNWPVLTVIQILQINLRITCILVLNSSVHSFPRLLNHHRIHSNKITYHNSLSLISTIDLTAQLATNTTDIHIDDFNPKDRSQRAKVFLDLVISMNYFNFFFNEYYDINFEHLPKPVVFSLTIFAIEISQTNYNLLNRCFKSFSKKYRFSNRY